MMIKEQDTYFLKRPPLPVLGCYALQSILEPMLRSVAEHVLPGHPNNTRLRQVQALVEQAETEMVATCIGYDLGMHMLDSSPAIIDDALDACYATDFPFGTAAVELMRRIAMSCADLPQRAWTEANVRAQAIVLLHHYAEPYYLQRIDVDTPMKFWQRADWDAYFAHFPNEEFRIPVLTAVRNLRDSTPHAFNQRARSLFKYFFPESRVHLDSVTWRDEISIGKFDETDSNDDPDGGGHTVAR